MGPYQAVLSPWYRFDFHLFLFNIVFVEFDFDIFRYSDRKSMLITICTEAFLCKEKLKEIPVLFVLEVFRLLLWCVDCRNVLFICFILDAFSKTAPPLWLWDQTMQWNIRFLIYWKEIYSCWFLQYLLLIFCVLQHLNGLRIWHKLQAVICSAHYAQLGEQLIIWWCVGMQILYGYSYRKSFISLHDFMNIVIWLYDHIWRPCVWEMQTPLFVRWDHRSFNGFAVHANHIKAYHARKQLTVTRIQIYIFIFIFTL